MSDPIYLNFPIPMLKDAFSDIHSLMYNIMSYAGFVHTLNLNRGTDAKKMKEAGDEFFGITYGNPEQSYRNGFRIYNLYRPNIPKVGISKTLLFDFYNNPKTHYEIAVLLAFLAIKSILGTKTYIRMTNGFMIARMAGCTSTNEMPDPIPEPLRKFTSRRMLDKIKTELQLNWNMKIYAIHTRGFYVSLKEDFTMDKLAYEAEKMKKTNAEKRLKQEKKEAQERALLKLSLTKN